MNPWQALGTTPVMGDQPSIIPVHTDRNKTNKYSDMRVTSEIKIQGHGYLEATVLWEN